MTALDERCECTDRVGVDGGLREAVCEVHSFDLRILILDGFILARSNDGPVNVQMFVHYHELRGIQIFVANVRLNRLHSHRFDERKIEQIHRLFQTKTEVFQSNRCFISIVGPTIDVREFQLLTI